MKKIAIASAAMGGAALIAFGASGTFAAFSDTDTVNNTAATAGSLVIDATGTTTTAMAGQRLVPGQSVERTFLVENDGQGVAGYPSAKVTKITNTEDGCTSTSEGQADDCTNPSAGDLAAQTLVAYKQYAVSPNGTCGPAPTTGYVPLGILSQIQNVSAASPAPLAAGQKTCVAFQLTLVDNYGGTTFNNNLAQGDSFSVDIEFGITQVTGGSVAGSGVQNPLTPAPAGLPG
ncbi:MULTISPECIES: TasA family protein [unclassified Blastococcus]